MDEQDLIHMASKGNIDAFCSLVSLYDASVYRLCYLFTGDAETAFDLFLDTFKTAWNAISLFDCNSSILFWLSSLIRQKASNFRKPRGDSGCFTAMTDVKITRIQAFGLGMLYYGMTIDQISQITGCSVAEVNQIQELLPRFVPIVSFISVPAHLTESIRRLIHNEDERYSMRQFLSRFRFTLIAMIIILLLWLLLRVVPIGNSQPAQSSTGVTSDVPVISHDPQILPGTE